MKVSRITNSYPWNFRLESHTPGLKNDQSLCRASECRGRRLLGSIWQVSVLDQGSNKIKIHLHGSRKLCDLQKGKYFRFHEVVSLDGFKERPRALRILGYHNPQGTHYEATFPILKPIENQVPTWDGSVEINPSSWQLDTETNICSAQIDQVFHQIYFPL